MAAVLVEEVKTKDVEEVIVTITITTIEATIISTTTIRDVVAVEVVAPSHVTHVFVRRRQCVLSFCRFCWRVLPRQMRQG